MPSSMSPVYLKHALYLKKCHQLDDPPSSQARLIREAGIGQISPAGGWILVRTNQLHEMAGERGNDL